MFRNLLILMLGLALLGSCSRLSREGTEVDSLPSWVDGPVKSAIVEYVTAVTSEGSPTYVAPEDRIATFDNDGTLWCEHPVVQLAFLVGRLEALAPEHPDWEYTQPFKAALEGDEAYLVQNLGENLMTLFEATHAGMTRESFRKDAGEFFSRATHPDFNQPFTKTVYQPMLELLEYLRANGFKTYICSGGGIDFMRVVSQALYGIPPEQVIGSHGLGSFEQIDGEWMIVKGMRQVFVNDKLTKPVGIDLHIGRVPVFAAGNVRSGGDIGMLTYSQTSRFPSFQLLINHDDPDREFAYGEENRASLTAAEANGWHVVSMKNDWKRVFPFREPKEP